MKDAIILTDEQARAFITKNWHRLKGNCIMDYVDYYNKDMMCCNNVYDDDWSKRIVLRHNMYETHWELNPMYKDWQ